MTEGSVSFSVGSMSFGDRLEAARAEHALELEAAELRDSQRHDLNTSDIAAAQHALSALLGELRDYLSQQLPPDAIELRLVKGNMQTAEYTSRNSQFKQGELRGWLLPTEWPVQRWKLMLCEDGRLFDTTPSIGQYAAKYAYDHNDRLKIRFEHELRRLGFKYAVSVKEPIWGVGRLYRDLTHPGYRDIVGFALDEEDRLLYVWKWEPSDPPKTILAEDYFTSVMNAIVR